MCTGSWLVASSSTLLLASCSKGYKFAFRRAIDMLNYSVRTHTAALVHTSLVTQIQNSLTRVYTVEIRKKKLYKTQFFGLVPRLHKMAVCRKRFPQNGTPFAFLRQKPKGVPNLGNVFTRRCIQVFFSSFLPFYVVLREYN